jgi:hypothetical protein
MSDPTADLQRLEARYRARFAGHPRVTRDADELDELLVGLDPLATALTGADAARVVTLREMWGKELEQIRLAQAVPYAVPAARLRTWGDLTVSRYGRAFAGKDRQTRDVGLLMEIQVDLQGVRAAVAELSPSAPEQGLARTLVQYDEQLRVYNTEIDAIRSARRQGSPADQGTRLAKLANEQFASYERHFAGHPRVSRHPATLERILASLDEIRRGMVSLQLGGFLDASNTRNQGVVDARIKAFGAELDAIRRARAEAPLDERVAALGNAANQVFGRYREAFAGQTRRSADVDTLDQLFELLWPIAR